MDVEISPKPIKPTLSPAQRQAALLLASGFSQADAARTIGRTRWTVGQWLRFNPHFQAEVDRLLEESRQQVLERLPKLIEMALDTIEQALSFPKLAGTRIETARFIMDRFLILAARFPNEGALDTEPPPTDVKLESIEEGQKS